MSEYWPGNEKNNTEREQLPTESIDELLPNYYDAHGRNGRYATIYSMQYFSHEVAWMEYKGYVEMDITGRGREGEEFSCRALKCACDFKEGVGWRYDENYGLVGMVSAEKCPAKDYLLSERRQELAQEYTKRFVAHEDSDTLAGHVAEVILDLIEKEKNGECVGERPGGARFWGGHFYAQVAKEISGCTWEQLHRTLAVMQVRKQIQMEGMVVQSYYEPPAPHWDEYARLSRDDWTVVVKLPSHSHMNQSVQFSLVDNNGQTVAEEITGPHLDFEPTFGVDVSDVQKIEAAADEIITQAISDPTRFA